MHGTYKAGFTILEILIVVAILAILATIAVPTLHQRMQRNYRQTLVENLNRLAALAWQQALSTHTLHRLLFNLDTRTVSLEHDTGSLDAQGQQKFKPVLGTFTTTTYTWHENIEVRKFFIEGINELTGAGKKVVSMWIYITPEGLAQDASIQAVEHKQHQEIPFSVTLNPFSVQFTYHETSPS